MLLEHRGVVLAAKRIDPELSIELPLIAAVTLYV